MSDVTPTAPLSEPIDAEIVTLTCDECGEQITAPAKGKGSAPWKMGTHRYVKHKAKRSGTKAKADATAEAVGARPVLGVVRDIADGITSKSGPPSAADLAAAGGRGLTWVTLGAAAFVVESDPRFPPTPEGDAIRNDLIEHLTLPEKAGADVLRPVARMVQPTKVNKKFGRGIVDNVDVLGSFVELLSFGREWSRYLRDRRVGAAEFQPAQAPLYTAPYGHVPSAADLEGITSSPPQSGHVISAEDVAKMQQQGGAV